MWRGWRLCGFSSTICLFTYKWTLESKTARQDRGRSSAGVSLHYDTRYLALDKKSSSEQKEARWRRRRWMIWLNTADVCMLGATRNRSMHSEHLSTSPPVSPSLLHEHGIQYHRRRRRRRSFPADKTSLELSSSPKPSRPENIPTWT